MEEVFKKADISERIKVEGEHLTNLRFADDIDTLNNNNNKTKTKHLGKQFKKSKLKKSES